MPSLLQKPLSQGAREAFSPPGGLQVVVITASAVLFVQAAKKEDTNANEVVFCYKGD